MKIAIVHDWLTNTGGAERVVEQLHKLYPDAPIYTSVYDPGSVPILEGADIRTTWLNYFPFKNKHKLWSVLRPLAFKSLNLKEYDVIISSSSAESKNVRARKDAVHICYCYTPIRYYWSHYEEYKSQPGLGPFSFLAKLILPIFVLPMRWVDYRAAQKIDYFACISKEVQSRVNKYYKREAEIIAPPVDIDRFENNYSGKRSGFVIAGRQIPYKRFDLAVQACTDLNEKLVVIGNGSEHQKLKQMAGKTIQFETNVGDMQMVDYFKKAEAFIFPNFEDFGIVPVEAMAAGTPVIAYGKGGALDYVVEGKSGTFFKDQTVDSLIKTIKKFKKQKYNRKEIKLHAGKFSADRFRLEFKEFVDSKANN